MAYAKDRKQINIWPRLEEHETLLRRAKAVNLSLAEYCLLMSLHGKIPTEHLPQ